MPALDEEENGDTVVATVATPARTAAVIADLVGSRVAFGPVAAGPGGMATATAEGSVGRIGAHRAGPDTRRSGAGPSTSALVAVAVPVDLDVSVLIGRRTVPVDVTLMVHLRLHAAMSACGTVVEVDLDDIAGEDIEVESHASGVGGVLVRRLGDLDEEIRQHVRVYISDLLDTEDAVRARRLPVDG